MSLSDITFRGIAPIHSPLSLHLGVDQFSTAFIETLKSINLDYSIDTLGNKTPLVWQGKIHHLGGEKVQKRQYQSTQSNSKDVRLMSWSPANNPNVMFHVFANHIAIAEIELTINLDTFTTSIEQTNKKIEEEVQNIAKGEIESYLDDFYADLERLKAFVSQDFVFCTISGAQSGDWVARTMLLNDEQLKNEKIQSLLTHWLMETSRPSDAADIIARRKNESLTWLNYAVINAKPVGHDPKILIMVLAQYYYVSQENSNCALRGAIEAAYAQVQKQKSVKMLASTRTACRLNQISYYENIKFLSKPNRALLEDILNGWQYNQLVENSERMVEICNARLQEDDNKKRERSTVMTDFLLVTLSFFTVFELSLYLTEFSREMMSRPALDYNDSKSSYFLGVIAEVDADIMFSFGFGLTLLLIIVYRYIKRN
jgi:hypothetical protein